MKHLAIGLLTFIFSFAATLNAASLPSPHHKGVTYTLSGGRFGDNILSYYHARWVSYKYKLPLIYRPFPFSDQLELHREGLKEALLVNRFFETLDPDDLRLFTHVCPYFPENNYEINDSTSPGYPFSFFPVDWEDPKFKKELKRLMQPLYAQEKLNLPADRISVAVHLRKGGGFDPANMDQICPLKFCPLDYYIGGVRRIHETLKDKLLHLHIFTDDPAPEALVKKMQLELSDLDITYSFREVGNRHDQNVLEDFFKMIQCDCLIRSHSNYALTAAKVADFKIEISPVAFSMENDVPHIHLVEMRAFGQTNYIAVTKN